MTPTRIVLLSHEPELPSLSLVAADGRVIERSTLEPDPEIPPEPLPCVLVVPGADALARWLVLPVRTEAQAGPAAALLLEEQLATPREQSHLTLGQPEPDGQRLAVVVDRAVLAGWTDRATALGLFPEVIIPDHLTLPDQVDEEVVAVRFGETYAARGSRMALSCEADLLPLVLGERPWREIADAGEIEAMLAAAAAAPIVNLLQPTLAVAEPPSTWKQLRAALVMIGLLVLSPLVISSVKIWKHEAAAQAIDEQTEARVRAALPRTEPVVNPDVQLRTRIERLSASGQFPLAATGLFTALSAVSGMELDGMVFEADRPLRATVSYAAPTDLERFRAAAAQAGLRAEATGGGSVQNGRLVSDLTLSRGAP